MLHNPELTASGVAVAPARREGPIGVFDSGVGGLTVARELVRRLPDERIIYIADQAHVPYGGRPLEEVRELATKLSAHLFASGAKAVLMACNISSATALENVRARFGRDRALGVIQPGAAAAVDETRSGKIGVLATAGTVASRAYTQAISAIAPFIGVTEVACPKFVPLVEAGQVDSDDAADAAREYLAPILAAGADTVVLGCTHYPFLLSTLARVAGPSVVFVDPAKATVAELSRMLDANQLAAGRAAGAIDGVERERHTLFTTGDAQLFRRQLAGVWPEPNTAVDKLAWSTIDPR